MLPVSGAEQLNTSDAHNTLPISSARGAYSRLVNPAPRCSPSSCAAGGRNRFHSPSAFARALSSSTMGITCQRSAPRPASWAS